VSKSNFQILIPKQIKLNDVINGNVPAIPVPGNQTPLFPVLLVGQGRGRHAPAEHQLPGRRSLPLTVWLLRFLNRVLFHRIPGQGFSIPRCVPNPRICVVVIRVLILQTLCPVPAEFFETVVWAFAEEVRIWRIIRTHLYKYRYIF